MSKSIQPHTVKVQASQSTFSLISTSFGDLHYQKQLDDNREAATTRLNTLRNISFETPTIDTDDDNFKRYAWSVTQFWLAKS